MTGPRRRAGFVLRIIAAAYILAVAALPFAHHDLVCHVKSNTHCGTCHIGTSSDPDAAPPPLAAAPLAYAGLAVEHTASIAASCELSPSAGRAPPVL